MNFAIVFFIVNFEQMSLLLLVLPMTFSRYFLLRDLANFNVLHMSSKTSNIYCVTKL